jgi:hypothetical protein
MITKLKISWLVVLLLVFVLPLRKGFPADSPFEIDIRELEKGPAKTEAAPGKVIRPGKSSGQSAEKFRKYPVRNGDTVYLILTRRFGLSARKAENLIPEVLRINNITRNTTLSVGRMLLLPAGLRESAAPVKTPRAALAPPVTAATQPAVSAQPQVLSPAQAISPSIKEICALWAKLLPLNQSAGTSAQAEGKAADADRCPVLPAADGGRIVIFPAGTPLALAENLAGAAKGTRIVIEDPDYKHFLATLLKAAGFDGVEENAVIIIGDDPKLTVSVDFKIVRKIKGTEQTETILLTGVNKEASCFPGELVDVLNGKGFRVVESCRTPMVSPPSARLELHSITSLNPEEILDSLLNSLAVTSIRSRRIMLDSGRKGTTILSVTADRYFQDAGKRFIVKFSDKDPYGDSLLWLFEAEGYTIIPIDLKDDFRAMCGKLFEKMDIRNGYAKYRFRSAESGRYEVEMTAFLVARGKDEGKRLCLTNKPVDDHLPGLLAGMRWDMQ